MIFGNAKSAVIREGSVKKITDESGTVLWQKPAAFTNLADPSSPDWLIDYRLNSSCGVTAASGYTVTNWMHCNKGDVLRVKGLNLSAEGQRLTVLDSNGGMINIYYFTNSYDSYENASSIKEQVAYDAATDVSTYVMCMAGGGKLQGKDNMRFRLCYWTDACPAEDIIITINQEIPENSGGVADKPIIEWPIVWHEGYGCSYYRGNSFALTESNGYCTSDAIAITEGVEYVLTVQAFNSSGVRIVYADEEGIVVQNASMYNVAVGENIIKFTPPVGTWQIRIRAYATMSGLVWSLTSNNG